MKAPPLRTRIAAARRRLPQNVRALGWVSFANDAASELAYPIVPLFLTITLGAPVAVVGVIEGIAEGTATGVRLLSGWVSDRMGERRKPWIVGGYSVSALSRALLAAAPGWGLVLVARIVDRLGKGARGTPRDALIRDSTPRELLGSAFGYHRALDTAGAIAGPLVAVALLESGVSLRGILWVAAGVGFGVLVVLRGVREAPARAERRPGPTIAWTPLPPAYWTALAVWVVFSLGNSSDVFLVLRARNLGLGAVVVVLAYAVYNVVYASLSWPFGALSDRVPRVLLLGSGLAVFAAVYFAFATTSHGWSVWPLFAVYGVYIAATEGVARAWIADKLPDRAAVGTAYGIFFLATAAAALVASVVAGVLWSYVSPRAPFVVGAAAALAALALLLVFELGWQARPGAIKAALAAAGIVVAAATAFGIAFEHHRLADAFRTSDAEPVPAAFLRPCGPVPGHVLARPGFPAGGTVYTARSQLGPTVVLTGYAHGDIRKLNASYQAALPPAGYTVLRSEIDPADSEVVFANGHTSGEVALTQECRDRVRVRVTIRPQ
jgi:MFS family permease